MMKRLRIRTRAEDGQVLMIVLGLIMLMTTLALALVDIVDGGNTRSTHAVEQQTAFQAAEAGINDYTSKLVEDSLYYAHTVNPGESTRESTNGTLVGAGSTWPYNLTWIYPHGHDAWRSLPNGYEYNLEITPPSAATNNAITMLATGRPVGDTNSSDWQSVQTQIRSSSLADFLMFSNASVTYGSTATTNGEIYSNGTVTHSGTASANIYAYQGFSGSVTLQNGAQIYNGATAVQGAIPSAPINFNSFLGALVNVQNASQTGGVYLNNASVAAWQIVFQSNGTFTAQTCNGTGGQDVAAQTPTCGATTTYNVPANGAIYSPQTVIVSGQVHGRVTVASNNNIDIGGNISYVTPGQDVLGMIAASSVVVSYWVPNNLTWTGATLAQSGSWASYNNDGSHGTMTFTGSTATYLGGSMSMFQTRVYNYDPNLLYLPPPWFPTFQNAYTTLLFRQVSPTP
jgi:Tfp pilus assembly protein PilX